MRGSGISWILPARWSGWLSNVWLRRYRIAVYEAFRKERREYDRRIEAWRRVERGWESAGRPAHEQSKLMAWLAESIDRFERGRLSSLPAKPQFGVAPGEVLLASRASVAELPPPLLSDTPAMTLPLAAPSAKPTVPLPHAQMQPPPASHPSNSVVADEPAAESAEPRDPAAAANLKSGLADSQESPDLPIAAAKPEAHGSRVDTSATVHSVNQPPVLPIDIAQRATQVAAPPPANASVERTASSKQRTESAAASIDLMELYDRLSGYKVAVAALNGRLQNPEPMSSVELTPLVEALDELITRRGDLMLYLKLVADDSGSVQRLESPAAAVSLLSAKISAARQRIEGRHDDMLITRLHAELAVLDQLSRRVAVLAARLQEQR